MCYVFFFKQKTAYDMRISDWSSDVCSSDLLFSRKPLEEIKTIRTDGHSRTSNLLARVLASRYWKSNATFGNTTDADAFVLIGDRTFGLKDEYPYVYDLAEIGRAHVCTPVTNAHLVCRLLLDKKNTKSQHI